MRKQVELTFVIGFDTNEVQNRVLSTTRLIIRSATALCGGCTVDYAQGYWREDGADRKQNFTGDQHQERAFVLSLTCEPEKEKCVYEQMKTRIKSAVALNKVNVNWVHVKRTEFTGMHFSVKEAQSKQTENRELFRQLIAMGSSHINRSADEMIFRNRAEDLYENLFGVDK